ncbi:uncharacterized protein LOC111699503 [Eurytemora carolleeae]|uniref:uncharacterized protein LOC111699503 n=1 Tax=Eurytemora carolleeae TaxID=1294199 RepID=UPI000C776E90|nr:uncharacterized protein LOC111699503 [Eurytemora carolleeae]|eukprot:XP_023325959.1 uncharacterized protein LOC111699503 [Eurytemora affinis]
MERRDGEYGKERMRVEIRKGEWKEENESRKKRRRDGKKRRRVEIREGEWKEEKESGKKEGGMERREGGNCSKQAPPASPEQASAVITQLDSDCRSVIEPKFARATSVNNQLDFYCRPGCIYMNGYCIKKKYRLRRRVVEKTREGDTFFLQIYNILC